MEEKKFKVGDWIRVRTDTRVHELAEEYRGGTYKIIGTYCGFYILSCDELGLWKGNSFLHVNCLTNLINKRRKIT